MPPFDPEKKILALDPARLTGYAHSNGQFGTWDIGTGDARLERLRDFILDAAKAWGCLGIACEYSAFGSPFVATKARHNEHLGVIRQCAGLLRVPVTTYAPASIKKFATGSGKAEKRDVMRACELFFKLKPRDDNQGDALMILAMCEQGYATNTTRKKKPRAPKKASAKAPRKKKGMLF